MIEIRDGIEICKERITFKFSRSGGPGGQNVNKVNTRVTLLFDLANAETFSDSQKKQILRCLATRADKNSVIRVVSQKYRTQKANRKAAIERLQELLRGALETRPVRKKTKVPQLAREKRLEGKKQRSMLKRQRAKISSAEYED